MLWHVCEVQRTALWSHSCLAPSCELLGDQTQIVRLVRQVPLPRNQLTGPSSVVQVLFCGSGWCSVCYTAQVILKLEAILQPRLPECWDNRHGPPQPGSMLFFRTSLAEAWGILYWENLSRLASLPAARAFKCFPGNLLCARGFGRKIESLFLPTNMPHAPSMPGDCS